ncbi:MAG: hypothetical protein E5Y88_00085 [Mesorhizobium sp.]|uniref:HEPN domain-containing protein n=2 Tax=Mesorhizobium TaxID=68287 RepID=A0A2P9AV18_9HYPH|nr:MULTISPECIES: hypothetical protein [Mesorhizobium]AZO69133.1 hypothetical protein EJ075_32285 [Mesorhizobium sp. M6A.T.Cr.TU.016.01.1.1]PAQ03675.1 hypothetical protein CIT25_03930 [Mesorhizobium mediterraneum]RUU96295.1 hypothetical protein EOB36_30320 [Mesorhizobium sp. M6A.T.Cr.TU.017.01.1.1]RWN26157.1 MAG: hypothetical protein EOR95_26550 [Mesorhizobium sp.]RWN37457.1 MAG: hypothetical protein EOR96_23925 [Mesorhizobium sp.]
MNASYPGEEATAEQVLGLASEFRNAAIRLLEHRRKGNALSLVPCRFTALHAIELYLNAHLLLTGSDHKALRGLQHDFATRTAKAIASGLVLRKRTAHHLSQLTGNREYLVTRYGPEMTTALSQINRLIATLNEVAAKVEEPAALRGSTPKPTTV